MELKRNSNIGLKGAQRGSRGTSAGRAGRSRKEAAKKEVRVVGETARIPQLGTGAWSIITKFSYDRALVSARDRNLEKLMGLHGPFGWQTG